LTTAVTQGELPLDAGTQALTPIAGYVLPPLILGLAGINHRLTRYGGRPGWELGIGDRRAIRTAGRG
jgi:hypothetical protein